MMLDLPQKWTLFIEDSCKQAAKSQISISFSVVERFLAR